MSRLLASIVLLCIGTPDKEKVIEKDPASEQVTYQLCELVVTHLRRLVKQLSLRLSRAFDSGISSGVNVYFCEDLIRNNVASANAFVHAACSVIDVFQTRVFSHST
jgi:hypothetical protein